MELQREKTDPAAEHQARAARARAQLADAATILLRGFPDIANNFGYAAAQIMGEVGADERIMGFIDFAVAYARAGWEAATDAIQANSGIPVQVVDTRDRRLGVPGYLVGLLGIDREDPRILDGVAVVEDRKGRQDFVVVAVLADGKVFKHPMHYEFPVATTPEIVGRLARL